MTMRTVENMAIGAGLLLGARVAWRRLTRYDLRDRVVLITGGSRGLGLVLARELVKHDPRIAICARDADELERARIDLEARGGRVLAVPCDITDRDQVASLVARVRDELGPIDVLVNNAGIIQGGPMELMTSADYEQAMAVHFWGSLHLVLAVAPAMRARRDGRIVNITSFGGRVAVPHLLPYAASKFAQVGLSEGLRAELARYGVKVTTVIPGLMRTGSPPRALFKGKHRAEYAWFAIIASLPVTSMSAERAARQIISALRHGDPEVVLSVQARIALRLHAIAPRLVERALAATNRLLPEPDGIGTTSALGRDSASRLAPSFWTRATDKASARNNEL